MGDGWPSGPGLVSGPARIEIAATGGGAGFAGLLLQPLAEAVKRSAHRSAVVTRNVRMGWYGLGGAGSSATLRPTLEKPRLFFVPFAESLPEERAETGVGVADHVLEDVAIQLPVALFRRPAEQSAPLGIALELLLERIGVEGGEHGFVARAQPGEHGHLVNPQVLKGALERGDRLEISGVVLDQQVVKRIFGIGGELDGIVLAPRIAGDPQAELVFELLARA